MQEKEESRERMNGSDRMNRSNKAVLHVFAVKAPLLIGFEPAPALMLS
jgi:hypothetical protein